MREDNLLQQAITAARAGRELTARDMFLRVVKHDPNSELAWMWLTGLLDDLDDRIEACEQIVRINPRNANAKNYLAQLSAEKQKLVDAENIRIEKETRRIRDEIKLGRKDSALTALRELALNPQLNQPEVWRLLADISPELDERVRALEKLSAFAPDDLRVAKELNQARHFQSHPIHQAELYEERGEIDKALFAYRMAALKPESKEQWNRIYWKVTQLENLKQENIAHVSPALSIARLTAGPPLVYFMFVLAQVGVNPFAHAEPLFWFGMLWVTLGGFMIALSAVRSHNRFWMLIFRDVGSSGTPAARLATAAAGWILVILPHVMLFVSAWYRLLDYLVNLLRLYQP